MHIGRIPLWGIQDKTSTGNSALPSSASCGGGLDESPHCYKDLQGVLAAHAGTIRILHVLRPIGVAMADTEDPYRD